MNQPKRRLPEVYIIEESESRNSAASSSAASDASPEIRRQKLLIRIGVLIPLVLLAFNFAHGAGESKYLPDRVLGVWQTSDSRYADCYMEITPATIVFGNARRGYLLYFVSSVQESDDRHQDTFLVHYTDLDGVKYQMSIVHKPGDPEVLYFSHQAGVAWTRRPSN